MLTIFTVRFTTKCKIVISLERQLYFITKIEYLF
jgi:hypothetical protein